jgi:hypothetical protein
MSADSHAASGRGIGGTRITASDLGLQSRIRWLGDCRSRGQRSLAYETSAVAHLRRAAWTAM